jgi:predicted ArsR family transcriptional regulator
MDGRLLVMATWSFLTSHARVLMCIAHDPGARLRDIAASLGITERSAHGIVSELVEAGYVVKQKDGRRNRYRSRRTSRSRSPLAGIAQSARSWPFLPAPTRRCDRPEGRTKAAASPAHRRHRRAGSSRRDQRRNLARQAAAAALPSCGPTAKGRAVACRCCQARQHALPAEYSQLRP